MPEREKPEPRGIECPKCGCRHLPVSYTRQVRDGVIRRVRICANPYCGRKIVTTERITSDTAAD